MRKGRSTTPVFIQNLAGTSANVGGNHSPFTIPLTGTNHLLILGIATPGGAVTSVTDNATGGSNAWVSAVFSSDTSSTNRCNIYYVAQSKPGATTITINYASALSSYVWHIEASEMNPTLPLDSTAATNNGAATTTPAAPPVITSTSRSLVVSVGAGGNNFTGIYAGNLFTDMTLENGDVMAYLLTSVPTAGLGARWNESPSGSFCAVTAAFKGH